ncbi:hypothetical protein HX882_27170 [Pseudomonas gingeri]|uniref:Uncharacterized protein n=1 Tax=Pseudomonas gingeri TaxID=117681 RepID=A0A7Y8C4V2_9PSED|nr:hypothetical protein [Pseudomonas gingeri]NWA25572.1 hypothetical protein [Pseudomonas gingeri]NWB99573.1 hypothetical protein [Pseudomonas gingeri]
MQSFSEYFDRVAGGAEVLFDYGPVPVLPEDEYWRTRAGYLDDLMFHALLRPLIDVPRPLLQEGQGDTWTRRSLRLTTLGEQMLAGQAHWLDQAP